MMTSRLTLSVTNARSEGDARSPARFVYAPSATIVTLRFGWRASSWR